jgi:hypothetical protein
MNREQRRRPEGREQPPPQEPNEVIKKGTPPDVTSTRAKSSLHGKVTADKWNQ